jgi:hypothetical protein
MDPVHLEHVNFGKIPVFHQIFMKSPPGPYKHYLEESLILEAKNNFAFQYSHLIISPSVSLVHLKKLKITYLHHKNKITCPLCTCVCVCARARARTLAHTPYFGHEVSFETIHITLIPLRQVTSKSLNNL